MYVHMQQIYQQEQPISVPPPHYHETMLYHTTARNVGLYTSLSLASLGAARALLARGKHIVAFIIASCALLFLILAMDLNSALIWTRKDDDFSSAPTSKTLPYALAVAHMLMCIALLVAIWRGIHVWRLDSK